MEVISDINTAVKYLGNHAITYRNLFLELGDDTFAEQYGFSPEEIYSEAIKNGSLSELRPKLYPPLERICRFIFWPMRPCFAR